MSSNLRIHISPVGFDQITRITDALKSFRADRVYLISYKKDDFAANRLREIKTALGKHSSIEVKEVYIDIWDLFGCLEKYRQIFSSEKGHHIYVNVSTGSKIVCIAGMLSCMLWQGTPYYTKLDYTGGEQKPGDKNTGRTVIGTEFLPVYRINRPAPESMQVLSAIRNAGGKVTKKKLIEMLQSSKPSLMPIYGPSQTRSAPHSRLRGILDPLERDWGFIEIRARGRQSEVALTEQGENALRIFGSGSSER